MVLGFWATPAYGTAGNLFTGLQNDTFLFNRVLSATEVKNLYKESLTGYPNLLNHTGKIFTSSYPIDLNIKPALISSEKPQYIDLSNPLNRNFPGLEGLVAKWFVLPGLDGGKYLYDVVGTHHGTLTNSPKWLESSRPGGYGALSFDGADDYVNCGTSTTLVPAAAMSCEAWFRADESGGDFWLLLVSRWGQTTNSFHFSALDGGGGRNPRIFLNLSISGVVNLTSTLGFASGAWTHVLWSYDGSTLAIYLNGQPAGTLSCSGSILNTATDQVFIGQNVATDHFFKGLIDQVSIFNRALSATEVKNLYKESLLGYPNELNYIQPNLLTLDAAPSGNPTGTATLVNQKSQISSSGTFAVSTYTGSANLNNQKSTLSGSGSFTAPVYTGTGILTNQKSTLSSVGSFVAPTYTGSGSLSNQKSTVTLNGTFTAPVYTGTSVLSNQKSQLVTTGSFAPPIYSGSGLLSNQKSTINSTGSFVAPIYTASVTLQTQPPTFHANGIFGISFIGSGSLSNQKSILATSGSFTAPVYTGTSNLQNKKSLLQGICTFIPPLYTGVSPLSNRKSQIGAAGLFTPPVYTANAALINKKSILAGIGAVGQLFTGTAALSNRKSLFYSIPPTILINSVLGTQYGELQSGYLYLPNILNTQHPRLESLVSWWFAARGLDGGKYWYDLCNRNHGLSSGGLKWIAGHSNDNAALFFDNDVNHKITVPYADSLNPGGDFSIVALVNCQPTPTEGIFEKTIGGNTNQQFSLFFENDNIIFRTVNNTGDPIQDTIWVNGQNIIGANRWLMLVATYGSNSTALYANGILRSSRTSIPAPKTGVGPVIIGGLGNNIYPLCGIMDNIMFFNRRLPTNEVQSLYFQCLTGYPGFLNRPQPGILLSAPTYTGIAPFISRHNELVMSGVLSPGIFKYKTDVYISRKKTFDLHIQRKVVV
jgi:hypothetical protein